MINNYKSLKDVLYNNLNLKPLIPTSDSMAMNLYPDYKKYYNKKYLSEI